MARVGSLTALVLCVLFVPLLVGATAHAAPAGLNTFEIQANSMTNPTLSGKAMNFDMNSTLSTGNGDPRRDRGSEPDDAGYIWRDNDENNGPRFEWLNVGDFQNVQEFRFGDDQNSGALDLGFDFSFWGRDFRRIYLDSDAWVSFTCGSTPYRLPVQNWPTAVGEGAAYDATICWASMDFTAGTEIWYWTNNQNKAIVWWAGNHSEQAQMIIESSGKVTMQFGANVQDRDLGVNMGDGRHGWYIQAGNGYVHDGRAIAFGPRRAWIQYEGPGIQLTPAELAFGDVYTGTDGTIDVNVVNNGAEDLVISALDCNEQAFIMPEFDQDIVMGSGESIDVQVRFHPNELRDYAADIRITCNAENAENGIFTTRASGRGIARPAMDVDPQSFDEEVNSGDILNRQLTIFNRGGGDLVFDTDVEIIHDGERDANARNIRSLNRAPVGPRRDDAEVNIDGMRFAWFQQNNIWGWLYDGMIGNDPLLDNNNCVWYQNGADWDNVDFSEYNAISIATYSQPWNQQYQNNLARLEEYVANGGALYYETANSNAEVRSPGGIYNDNQNSSSNGVLVVSPDPNADNYSLFAEICHTSQPNFWNQGEVIEGSSWLHAGYNEQQFIDRVNNGTIEWYQVIAVQQQNQGTPGAVAYGFGGGTVMTVAHPVGHCWANYNQDGMWGSIASEILYYLTQAGQAPWISLDPTEGNVAPNENMVLNLALGGEGLFEGQYEADLTIISNDPDNARATVNIQLWVNGVPNIVPKWAAAYGYPNEINWNAAYPDLFTGHPYDIVVNVANEGTDELAVDDISCENGVFTANPHNFTIAAGEDLDVTLTLDTDNDGLYEGQMIFESNDPDSPELSVFVRGETGTPPVIRLDPNAINDNLFTGGNSSHEVRVDNVGGSPLRFTMDAEIIAEGRDGNERSVRNLEGVGPRRDDAGELLGNFNWNRAVQNNYKAGIVYDYDNDLMLLTTYSPNWMAIVDPENEYQVIREWQPNGNPMGATWLNGTFYSIYWANQFLARWDIDGNNLGNLNTVGVPTSVTASPDGQFIMYSDNNNNRDLFIINEAGEQLGRINYQQWQQFTQGSWQRSLCWVDKHPDGQLWMNTPGHIWEMSVDTNNWQITGLVQNWAVQGNSMQEWDGLGHNKENLIWGSYGEVNYRIYDDGITEMYWLAFSPEDGAEIAAGGSVASTIALNANGLMAGNYVADVLYISNDPNSPVTRLRVNLTVEGAPDITVEWDEEDGFPNVLDFNAGDVDVFCGAVYTRTFTITNDGSDELAVNEIWTDSDYFTFNPEAPVLNPRQSQIVTVTFSPPDGMNDNIDATVAIGSNDPDEQDYTFEMHAHAFLPPAIDVDPQAIEDDLLTGETSDHTVRISNDGDAPLRWTMEAEMPDNRRDENSRSVRSLDGSGAPRRDDAGELIGQFAGINQQNWYCSPVGWDWDNDRMWVTRYNDGIAAAYTHDNNYENFEEVIRINCGSNMDGCWADGYLFLPTSLGSAQVNRWNAAGQNIGAINFGFGVYGMAADVDNEWLLVLSSNDWAIHVFNLDGEGNVVGGEIGNIPQQNHQQYHGNQIEYGFEWVSRHNDGQLWFVNYVDTRIYQIAVDTENWECTGPVQNFPVLPGQDQPYTSSAHDGKNMWVGGYGPATIRIYDDGASEAYWLTFAPEEGVIQSDDFTDVNVHLDAAGLFTDRYEATLHVLSNDPEFPDVEVMVTLDVTGAPDIDVTWPEEYGFDDMIDWNAKYQDELYNGGPYPMDVTIANVGTDTLRISDISTESAAYSSNFDVETMGKVIPGEEITVQFIFNAPEAGVWEGTMTIESNDGDEDIVDVLMRGSCTNPPVLTLSTHEVIDQLYTGDVRSYDVEIGNDGPAELRYETDIVTQDPILGRDANARSVRSLTGNHVGPRRDEVNLDGMRFAWFQQNNIWGWLYDGMVGNDPLLDNNNCVWYQNGADWDNVDFTEYNAICIATYSQPWNQQYQNNLGRLEEYVADGGALYYETANSNAEVRSPGGIYNDNQNSSSNGVLVVSPDPNADNYSLFAEICHESQPNFWNEGEVIEGSSWLHAGYNEQQFIDGVDNGTLEWYQVIAVQQQNQGIPGAVAYGFGGGTVMTVAHPVGHCWVNYNQEGMWGSIASEILYYLTEAGSPKWVAFEAPSGVVGANSSEMGAVVINCEGLLGGRYIADIYFLTNDPVASDKVPDDSIHVVIDITGVANIDVTLGGPEEDEAPANVGIVYFDHPRAVTVTVENVGTDDLELTDVVSDQNNEDFYVDPNDLDNFVLAPDEVRELSIWYNPSRENGEGEHAVTLGFITNDPRYADGYPVRVLGTALTAPILVLESNEIDRVVDEGDIEEVIFNLANDGGSDLIWSAEIVPVLEPQEGRDANARSVRSLDGKVVGPRRDEVNLEGMRFAWFQQSNIWGWLYDGMVGNDPLLDNNNCVWYQNGADWDNVDFSEYDAICIATYSQPWNQQYQNNLARLEEYVDGGGALYYETANTNAEVRSPGGIYNDFQNSSSNGILVVSPDPDAENYSLFAEICHESQPNFWNEGEVIEGSAWLHAGYNEQQFIDGVANGTLEWYQVLAVQQDNQQIPGAVAYGFGSGTVMTVAHPVGHCWANYNQEGMWGSIASEILYYLTEAGGSKWISMEPMEGIIGAHGDANVLITLTGLDVLGGDYQADIIFTSNDPVNPEQVLTINFTVHGRSVLDADIKPVPLVENAIVGFARTYVGAESVIPVTIMNLGSQEYTIEELSFDGDNAGDFATNIDNPIIVAARGEQVVNFYFRPSETGDRNARLHLFSDAMNVVDQEVYWDLTGFGMLPPSIYTRPDSNVPMQFVQPNGAPVNALLVIGNAEGQDRDDLVLKIGSRPVEQGRDANARTVRSLVNSPVPRRDQPESSFLLIQESNPWGYNIEQIFQNEQGLNYRRINTPNELQNIDLDDYEAMWVVGNEESSAWYQQYNNHAAEIDEWVDGGGAYYMSTGTNTFDPAPVHPGGLVRTQQVYDNTGITQLSQDECLLFDLMDWDAGTRLEGNSYVHCVYDVNNLNNIENTDGYQVMVLTADNGQRPAVANYNFGRGWCVVAGTTDGFLHNNPGQYLWGAAGSAMLWYLDALANGGLDWLTVNPEEGSIAAGQETEIVLTFSPLDLPVGDYFGELVIESNDLNTPELVVGVSMNIGEGRRLRHFTNFTETAPNHSLQITGVSVEDQPASTGWEVGVFTPNNVLSGAGIWVEGEDLGIAAWGADADLAPNQFNAGEHMTFKVWDDQADVEYIARATVAEGSLNWADGGYTVLSLGYTHDYTCVVPFQAGWNLISINVTPPAEMNNANGPDIRTMMAQFRIDEAHHHVILMKNERGNFYAPANRDFNNIPFWNTAEGYQVRMDGAIEGSWTGVQIDAQADVPVAAGWNMIAYYPTYDLTCARNSFNAISSIVENVVLTKDGVGHFASPRNNFSNMAAWEEGKGYQINVDASVVLNYPGAQQNAAAIAIGASDASVEAHWAEPAITGANMSVLVTGISGVKLADDDQVAAFSTSGRLVGVGRVTDGMVGLAVWGDDISTEAVDGLIAGEAFTLKLWDADKESIVDLRMEGLVYATDGFAAANASAAAALPNEFYVGQNYPNPFNAVTRIAFGLPEASHVSIRVFDIAGREVATLVSGNLEAGHHTAVWSAEGFNSGVYLVKMETPGFSDVRKVTLVK